ncbi:hypothetical protein jhhlp_003451 [Lomentospora prolificans]|uniref:CSC1/OSCA1-like 7TM region domain-containing protein n=1 Tax=Lomentospora prolificans TaxID=41688 RepID=A0A2N3N8Z7_9PEZI|nr:hypothetical protein jhhlp_003451 [Lomentospora prolificans]
MSDSGDTEAKPASLQGMVTTFVTGGAVAIALFIVFLFIRKSARRFYAPRTYLGTIPEDERTPSLPDGVFNWMWSFWKIPDSHALKTQSLDGYLFLRFLRVCTLICFVGLCMTWPTLFPINATGGGNARQLDILSISNINTGDVANRNRLFGHVLVAWIFYGFVLYLIMRECIFYINLRQAFLLTPQYARRISSRTVLFTSVPQAYLNVDRIRLMFKDTAKHIWITGDTDKLDKLVEERTKIAMKLEGAEVKLLKLANSNRIKANGGPSKLSKQQSPPQEVESADAIARWVPKNKRPTHRLGFLGLVGKKVDTIEWAREKLSTLTPEIEEAQARYLAGDAKPVPAVFVEFYTQSDAQYAVQSLTHHNVLQMSHRYIGVRPQEVIWKNLKTSWWQKIIRRYAVLAFLTAMIIFWAIPVAFVASIAQVDSLRAKWDWLSFLDHVPSVVMGFITGLLPSVLLSILMSLVPVIIRLCARFAGEPTETRVELFTQAVYFAFQVIQVFLVTTVSGSVFSILSKIAQNPGKIFETLSDAIPKASNIYINFFIIQGITIASGVITQISGLVIFRLTYRFLANTPRAMYNKWTSLSAISWGSVLPVYTNIVVISITYSVIAPLMLFWSTIGMALFYLAYRYNILFVTDTGLDTRGLIYPRAIKQLLVGVYLAEICMVGMCAVSRAFWPMILMIVFLVFTVLFHITVQGALDPLLYNLPRSLEVEEERLMELGEPAETKEGPLDGASGAAPEGSNGKAATSAEPKGNFVMKFLKPWKYASYMHMRKLIPRHQYDPREVLEAATESNSYNPPSVNDTPPLLWIPQDGAGLSKHEIANTGRVIPITDEGCTLDDKNKIIWDETTARPPIWEEKPVY